MKIVTVAAIQGDANNRNSVGNSFHQRRHSSVGHQQFAVLVS